ncbi:MAG: glycoside hydrolase family 9 protein [Pseudobutyrivibrio sp.]|nr:glycoside hydrolase family 9 protein [Pseudobutyrivibrio sp.]
MLLALSMVWVGCKSASLLPDVKNEAAAKCYVDNAQSYSTNEIAIYWNSPVIYLIAGEIAGNEGGR